MDKVKIISIGCGQRGYGQSILLAKIEDYDLVALCDKHLDKAELLAKVIEEKTGKKVPVFNDYNQAIKQFNPDAALVSVDWQYHVELACDLMEKNIAVALEVGGTYSEEETWRLVDTYEKTQTPFMFLENVCYNKEELLATAVAKAGLLGEIVHCHGAYGHDLRSEVANGRKNRHYRLEEYKNRNCENYPTHELGPIAKMLNINRGNRMLSLVSRASKSRGIQEFVKGKEEYEFLWNTDFKQGDVVETIITCENGELITLKLDTSLPRFYSREFQIHGTKGFADMDHNMICLDSDNFEDMIAPHEFYAKYLNNAEKYYDKYLPKMWKEVTKETLDAGHGGIDYFELKAFAEHLLKGEEMPIDVYDAASWGAISYLSEISIANNGMPVDIPDFTRGKYKTRKPLDVIKLN